MPKTLLLADDSVTIQRVIELTFAHEDVRVVSVGDGRRALEWMESERPDIVLVDVEVPEVDGYAVAAHVKGSPRLEQVPVLLLAGAFEPVDDARAKDCGCDGVLIKPFEPKQLVNRVKELLARSTDAGFAASGNLDAESRAEMTGATVTQFPAISGRASDGPIALAMSRGGHGGLDLGVAEPEPLEPPARAVWDDHSIGTPPPAPAPRPVDQTPPPKVSLVSAFSALLAAEQSHQPAVPAPSPAPVGPQLTEANVEDAVRRVLTRMTDELVRRIVLETAERLIKEEITKIKEGLE